jgi:hypothetical protein
MTKTGALAAEVIIGPKSLVAKVDPAASLPIAVSNTIE